MHVSVVENRCRVSGSWHGEPMHLNPLSPVLARPAIDGRPQLQIGIAHATVLTGLADDERAFLSELEGGREVTKAEARRFARAVEAVTAAGGWAPPDAGAARDVGPVAVHGCGRLGIDIAEALVRWGAAVALHDDLSSAKERPFTFAPGVDGTCAGAAAAALRARGVAVRVGGGGESLAIAVCEGAPDSWLVRQWMLTDVPHLLVICDDSGAWVSHVVVPGVTACSRCRDVALTRDDPAWPYLALQLERPTEPQRRPAAPGMAGQAAAVVAASRAIAWLRDELVGEGQRLRADGSNVAAAIAPSSDCGCGAAGPVGDQLAARRAVVVAC